jgi:hypothetical protein
VIGGHLHYAGRSIEINTTDEIVLNLK